MRVGGVLTRDHVRDWWPIVLPLVLTGAMAVLVERYDALPILGLGFVMAGAFALLRWPELATLLVAFLLYTNIPVVAFQFHGVPKIFAGAFMLLLGLPLIHSLVLRREAIRADKIFLLLIAYMVVLMLSSLGAQDMSLSIERIQVFFLEGLALYWLLLNTVRTLPVYRRVIWTVLAAGSLLGGLSLYQMATRSYDQQFLGLAQRTLDFVHKETRDIVGQDPRMWRSDRAEGPVGETNRYAQIMIVLLPLAYVAVRRERSPHMRLAAAVAGTLILAGVLLTYSRSALLTLGVLAVAATQVRWVRPRHLVIAGLAGMLALPVVAPAQYKRLMSIGQVRQVMAGDRTQADASIRGRLTETLAAVLVFTDHPVLGVGPGQYSPFYSVEYQQRPEIKFRQIVDTRRAHNLYAELAAEIGAVGLFVFMGTVLILMRELWRHRRRWIGVRPELADLASALWLSLIAYLTTGVFLQLSYERYYWFLLALAGIAVYLMDIEARKDAAFARAVAASQHQNELGGLERAPAEAW